MELKDRILLIIKEHKLKQKELASIMGISESYVSYILAGRKTNLSTSVAELVQEKLGYSAKWVLTGDEPKYKKLSKAQNISDTHRKLLLEIEKLSDEQAAAVLVFMNFLGEFETALIGLSKEVSFNQNQ